MSAPDLLHRTKPTGAGCGPRRAPSLPLAEALSLVARERAKRQKPEPLPITQEPPTLIRLGGFLTRQPLRGRPSPLDDPDFPHRLRVTLARYADRQVVAKKLGLSATALIRYADRLGIPLPNNRGYRRDKLGDASDILTERPVSE